MKTQDQAERGGPYAVSPAKASADEPDVPLPHLGSPAAALRQVMAAHLLLRCDHIIEIGGAGLPITGYITHRPVTVTVVDPKIVSFAGESLNGAPCRVRHVRAKLQQLDLEAPQSPFGLVLLGLSLKPFGDDEAIDARLLSLVRAADVLILEHAHSLERVRGQVPALLAARQDRPAIDLDLTINDAALVQAGYQRRRFAAFGAF
ncbi:conserved hypothetical protein [Bosea sp. 62]|uniref:hypothetical protein n=1 Tax=unclassified Bosea (in: a-proteobacteria) TaxID=2653178 RepID=UPI0012593B95|nr:MULTISPECIES: hypothetical protein [unclassified Bosea (in: a-proteobacteria)]CAD5252384.1 conserved hypothetical protein [Bosea sp. 7B]CAD5279107.1 conserved hypothetical protein [Bosea sp. 21B]CAD5280227.1 conserved hypothetical protein [Bosea sp. 46]VVT59578.1 conserved hypothetical protein [Bosea sp. EC-HK365B]VXB34724.1 conserved hypothetical protein [Bosea sp. 62]